MASVYRSVYRSKCITSFEGKNVLYIAYVGKHPRPSQQDALVDTFKYGKSSDIYQREYKSHRKAFGTFEMLHIYPSAYSDYVETQFERELRVRNIHTEISINNKKRTELFQPTEEYSLAFVATVMRRLIKMSEQRDKDMLELEKLRLLLRIKELESLNGLKSLEARQKM